MHLTIAGLGKSTQSESTLLRDVSTLLRRGVNFIEGRQYIAASWSTPFEILFLHETFMLRDEG
jgi:hypothetical protein